MKSEIKNRRSRQYLHTLKKISELHDAALPVSAELPDDPTGAVNALVLAPALHAYVMWLLSSALRDGVERLYFLSRDGFLPCRIARTLCRELKLPIECRYFYCSRAALRIPMYHLDVEDALDNICRGGLDVTPGRLLLRAGLSEEEARALFPALGLSYGYSDPIPYAGIPAVRELLSRSEPFLEAMCRVSRARFPAAEGYFRQEGILDRGRFALVDSGWTGTMQRSIRKICEACAGEADLTGYYFGLYYLPKDCDPAGYRSFYFGPGRGLWNKALFCNNLFEVVYSAPHGTVLAYEAGPEGFGPVLGAPQPRIRDYIHRFDGQLARYTDRLAGSLTEQQLLQFSERQLRSMVRGLLARFMWAPEREEAEAFGSLPFSDDLNDAGLQDLAIRLDSRQLRENHVLNRLLVMLGLRRGIVRQSAWFEGSAVRSAEHHLWHRSSCLVYKLLLYLRRR